MNPTCRTQCPHGNHTCTLPADHGDGFTSSDPDAGPAHYCFRCNCTYNGATFHMHDGYQVD